MMTMKTDNYLDSLTEMESLPDVLRSYIPTDYDIERMEENPDKYMEFMNYFLSVDRSNISFDEDDTKRLKVVEKKIDRIIRQNMKFVD